jgi:glycolate oxidase
MMTDEAYQALEAVVGENNITREPGLLDSYTWQPSLNDDPEIWVTRPAAVVLPSSTEEVQEIVRACNEHGLKFKAFATGWGTYSAPSTEGVVQIDLRRMNRILDIDEKNRIAVLQPYVCGAQLQAEAMKVGLNTHIIGAGPCCSPVSSATSGWGVGWDGISMGYSFRNLMGVEWVLPTGEVLRLGSLGSDAGWFCPDGPGPSLKGIVRGSSGALSGMGVFTKAAVKLYNWPGPPQVEVKGLLLNAQAEVPENVRFFMCFFPDRQKLADATYKIGDEELGYLATKTALGAFIYCFAPHLLRKIAGTKALRGVLGKAMQNNFVIMLVGNSRGDVEHQERVLRKIVSEHAGAAMDAMKISPVGALVFMNFFRVSAIPLVYRMGGQFSTALDRNDTWDTQLNWADEGEKIKQKWIDRGGILDDLADNPYCALYENNTYSHCEEIFQYDVRNPEHLAALRPIFVDFTIAALEQCMEPLSAIDPRQRKLLSPLMGDYNEWQKKISAAFDPNQAADNALYTGEADFDFTGVEPERVARIEELVKTRRWE